MTIHSALVKLRDVAIVEIDNQEYKAEFGIPEAFMSEKSPGFYLDLFNETGDQETLLADVETDTNAEVVFVIILHRENKEQDISLQETLWKVTRRLKRSIIAGSQTEKFRSDGVLGTGFAVRWSNTEYMRETGEVVAAKVTFNVEAYEK